MFRHLMVPLDGSRLAELALPPAKHFAEIASARVTLLHVIEKGARPTVHAERHLTRADEADAYLRGVASDVFAGAASVECHVHDTEVGDVARSMTVHAEELGVDLIVLCTHGGGDLSRWVFGTIAQQVLADWRGPVLLVPHTVRPWTGPFECRRILVPVDFKPGHEQGIDLGMDVAQAARAEVTFLAVVPTFHTLSTDRAAAADLMPGFTRAWLDVERDEMRDELARRVEQARSRGLTARAEIAHGDAAPEIIDAANRLRPDLIVLASHRRKGLDVWLNPSVSSSLCHKSPACLLITPITD